MPNARVAVTVVTVCLPNDTPTDHLATAATARLAATPLTSAGPAGHFTTSTRWRKGQLLQPWQNTAAGGPVRLLDLDGMRTGARDAHWHRWHIWQRVVAGTPAAKPYWHFADRHLANPIKYPLERAQQHYLAQPRVAAMRTYNALPNKIMTLPTSHLEAFQAGAHAYAHLGWLSAVPGDAVITLTNTHLAPASGRLVDQLAFLEAANAELKMLATNDHLVALTAY